MVGVACVSGPCLGALQLIVAEDHTVDCKSSAAPWTSSLSPFFWLDCPLRLVRFGRLAATCSLVSAMLAGFTSDIEGVRDLDVDDL